MIVNDIEDWREKQYQDFQAELGKEVESEDDDNEIKEEREKIVINPLEHEFTK